MRNHMFLYLPLGVAAALLLACASYGADQAAMEPAYYTEADQQPVTGYQESEPFASTDDEFIPETPNRIVIYIGDLTIVVDDVEEALDKVEVLTGELGGYVQTLAGATIVVRIPAESFDRAIEAIEAFGQVSRREIHAIDVTEQYVDLKARLNNARKVRQRLEALLEQAQTIEEALAVEKELNRIGEEIERLEGKLKLLENQVAFCTITVTFERVERRAYRFSGMIKLPFPWLHNLHPDRLWY